MFGDNFFINFIEAAFIASVIFARMGHKKLERFTAIREFTNVMEKDEPSRKGKWHEYFGNDNPIVLELACGKGEYTENRAAAEPDKNWIGIDIKGNRMFIGARNCLQKGLKNAAFLRIPIDHITEYFAEGEVSEIWILFPDPFLRDSKEKNRLTHHRFLAQYQKVLQIGASIHLKTDSKPLFDFTNEVIAFQNCPVHMLNHNIYAEGEAPYPLSIKTHYEGMHLADNRTIQYVAFSLPNSPIIIPPKKVIQKEDGQSE
jgi:tRNA (guanine-N7-)-methyltransferase